MNRIKISIIVPVYNAEKYLRQCLDSIISQTLKDIEIICVDDGSTDSSNQILREYQKYDSRIQLITQKNNGLGAARNVGLAVASGEFIGFVDSDDFIDTNWFSALYEKAQKFQADVAIGNIKLYFQKYQETKLYRDNSLYQKLAAFNFFQAASLPNIITNIGVWDRIYRRTFLGQYNLKNPEHVIYEDALFSIQTSILANRITVVDNVYYYYRKNTGTAITDQEIGNDSFKLDFLKNSIEIKNFLQQKKNYSIFYTYYLKYFLSNALWHQSNISNRKTFYYFYKTCIQIVPKRNLFMVLKNNIFSVKEKIYALLLTLHCPLLCYCVFFYKRKRLKRS